MIVKQCQAVKGISVGEPEGIPTNYPLESGGGEGGAMRRECNPVFCHPERSEGSQALEKARFFAALQND
jgi:hypothetical protein